MRKGGGNRRPRARGPEWKLYRLRQEGESLERKSMSCCRRARVSYVGAKNLTVRCALEQKKRVQENRLRRRGRSAKSNGEELQT